MIELQLPRAEFAQRIAAASRVISAKSPLAELTHIRFEVADGGLTLAATNMEMMTRIKCPASRIIGAGVFYLAARTLADVVSAVNGDDVTIRWKPGANMAELTSARVVAKVASLDDRGNWPAPAKLDNAHRITLRAEALRDAIGVVIAAVSTEKTRPNLCGIITTIYPTGEIELIGADGFQLSRHLVKHETVGWTLGDKLSALIPREAAIEMARLATGDGLVTLDIGRSIVLTCDDIEFTTRQIDANAPGVGRALGMRDEARTTITVNRAEFAAMVRAGQLTSATSTARIELDFDAERQTVQLSTREQDVSEYQAIIDAAIVTTSDQSTMHIALSADYVASAVKTLTTEKIALAYIDEKKPLFIVPDGDVSTMHMIMPMFVAAKAVSQEAAD